jgi:hypothetical protein
MRFNFTKISQRHAGDLIILHSAFGSPQDMESREEKRNKRVSESSCLFLD